MSWISCQTFFYTIRNIEIDDGLFFFANTVAPYEPGKAFIFSGSLIASFRRAFQISYFLSIFHTQLKRFWFISYNSTYKTAQTEIRFHQTVTFVIYNKNYEILNCCHFHFFPPKFPCTQKNIYVCNIGVCFIFINP